jgi:putative ABC transport system permease protein
MLTNYLTLAFRNIFKRKGYSFLNIAGLTIGMSCCLLIFHYVSFEKSYDEFAPAAPQIVRVRLDCYQKGVLAYKSATSYPAIGPTIKKDYPEVENFCRLMDNSLLLSNDAKNKKFSESKGYYADAASINMLGVEILKGDKNTALTGPDKIILSESMANKYFDNEDAVGKTLVNRNGGQNELLEVTGVYKDYPANSHLIMNYLVSYATLGKEMQLQGDSSNASETAWGWYDFYVYLQLKPGADYHNLEAKLPAFTEKYINNQGWNKGNNRRLELHLLPLSDIHLYSKYNQEAEVNGNGQAVSFLFLIAIFIICIAWINYINLACARSVERAKEVGLRKVLGAMRTSLIKQFLMENFVMTFISLLLSLLVFFILLHPFDIFTGRDTVTALTLTNKYWLIFFCMFAVGTMLSGLYPAFVLSGFTPIGVLKGAFKNTASGLLIRKSLIVFQFITSVVLIAGTIIVYQQVKFMRDKSLGANINQTIVLRGPKTLQDSMYISRFEAFKTDVLQLKNIKNIAASSNVMGDEIYWTRGMSRLGSTESAVTTYNLAVDYDFISGYEIKIAAGRNFSPTFTSDKKAVILNESTVKLLGFSNAENAINQKVLRQNDTLTVIGVTANFHQVGLQKQIDPMVILLKPNISDFYSIKVAQKDVQQTITALNQTWGKHFSKDPFDYFFLDDSFGQQYKADMLFGKVFALFAFLAILIASFGLLGLSAYNVLQRTKEIGIRKVLGASIESILVLLSRDFLKLIAISLLLAIPVGWWLMYQWLQDYAYRVSIGWWVFALAGATALLIAAVTIIIQILKAVSTSPIKSLRTE